MASLIAQSMATGNFNPLKQEIDRIVTPVATTYEEALKYKSMLTLLFGHEQVYARVAPATGCRCCEATRGHEL
jgi:hypothetical protein